jgi:hypothetical protein
MSEIYSRRVTRWYYGGRGYASLKTAAKAQAKAELRDIVLGPVERYNGGPPERQPFTDLIGEQLEQYAHDLNAARLAAASILYERMFPHTDECRESVCWVDDRGERFAEWCKAARDRWLDTRTAEIVEAADV